MTWLKKYWWIVTIVPAIFVLLYFVAKFIILYLKTDIGDADTSDLDNKLKDDMDKLKNSEKETLEKIRKEKEEMWKKIDEGSPTPSDIFNKEAEDD